MDIPLTFKTKGFHTVLPLKGSNTLGGEYREIRNIQPVFPESLGLFNGNFNLQVNGKTSVGEIRIGKRQGMLIVA